MKILKISLVLLLTLITYSVNDFKSVGAVDTSVTWTMDTTATEHSLNGVYEFGTGIKEVTIYIPESLNITVDNGTEQITIIFYNSLGVIMNTLDGQTEFGKILSNDFGTIDAHYQFNFEALGISSTAVKLLFVIPTNYTDSILAPAGYIDGVNANSTVVKTTTEPSFGLFRFAWEELAGSSANYLQSDEILIPLGTEFVGLRYNFDFYGRIFEAESKMYFYDDSDILLDTLTLYPYETSGDEANPYGTFNISLAELVTNYEDVSYFTLKAAVWQYTPARLYIHNNSLLYIFDGEVNTVNFYSDTEIVYSHKAVLGSIARFPQMPPTKVGEVFTHWITANGVEYNWTAISQDMLIGDTVNFYAIFEDIPEVIVPLGTTPIADEESLFTGALTTMGFDDPISRTIVFGFVAVMTAGFMLWKGISVIATIVVVGTELFFFMYLGLIPMFVSIIIILLLIFIGLAYAKGGGTNE